MTRNSESWFMNLDGRKLVAPPPEVLALLQTFPRTEDFARQRRFEPFAKMQALPHLVVGRLDGMIASRPTPPSGFARHTLWPPER